MLVLKAYSYNRGRLESFDITLLLTFEQKYAYSTMTGECWVEHCRFLAPLAAGVNNKLVQLYCAVVDILHNLNELAHGVGQETWNCSDTVVTVIIVCTPCLES